MKRARSLRQGAREHKGRSAPPAARPHLLGPGYDRGRPSRAALRPVQVDHSRRAERPMKTESLPKAEPLTKAEPPKKLNRSQGLNRSQRLNRMRHALVLSYLAMLIALSP